MTTLIPIDMIDPNPWQTRQSADSEYIAELAADIEANGLLQAPMGRLVGDGPEARLQLAFGHNRLEAYRILGTKDPAKWGHLPVEVRELSDEQLADYAWAENERRREHTPLDRAKAIQRRIQDFGWTFEQVAQHLQLSRPVISNALRLLQLPADLQPALGDGRLSERAGVALLALFELPESMRKAGENQYDGDLKPSAIVRDALAGVSSDVIRNRVNRLAGQYSMDLGKAPWKIGDTITGEGVRYPVCKTCAARLPERNLCTDPECFRIKTLLHKKEYLEAASKASGILPVDDIDESSYGRTTFDSSWGSPNKNDLAPLRTAGCANLRLAYDEHIVYPEVSLKDLGYPKAEIICQKRSGYCTCAKGLEMQKEMAKRQQLEGELEVQLSDPEPDDDEFQDLDQEPQEADSPEETAPETPAGLSVKELEELARKARAEKREIGKLRGRARTEFALHVADLVKAGDVRAFRLLAAEILYMFKDDKTKGMTLDELLFKLGLAIAEKHEPWEPKSIHHILEYHNQHLAKFELGPISLPPEGALPAEGKTLAAVFGEDEDWAGAQLSEPADITDEL